MVKDSHHTPEAREKIAAALRHRRTGENRTDQVIREDYAVLLIMGQATRGTYAVERPCSAYVADKKLRRLVDEKHATSTLHGRGRVYTPEWFPSVQQSARENLSTLERRAEILARDAEDQKRRRDQPRDVDIYPRKAERRYTWRRKATATRAANYSDDTEVV